jgi:hypothetical protein
MPCKLQAFLPNCLECIELYSPPDKGERWERVFRYLTKKMQCAHKQSAQQQSEDSSTVRFSKKNVHVSKDMILKFTALKCFLKTLGHMNKYKCSDIYLI